MGGTLTFNEERQNEGGRRTMIDTIAHRDVRSPCADCESAVDTCWGCDAWEWFLEHVRSQQKPKYNSDT
jgi:hypothetical protein